MTIRPLEPKAVDRSRMIVEFDDGIAVQAKQSGLGIGEWVHRDGRSFTLWISPGAPGLHEGRPINIEGRCIVAARALELESRSAARQRQEEARRRSP